MTRRLAHNRGTAYGDRYDDQIRKGISEGLSPTETARRLHISSWFVLRRIKTFGIEPSVKPRLHRRPNVDLSRPVRRAHNPSRAEAATITKPPNEAPSRLRRALRHRSFIVGDGGLDPSHGLACLHVAGLTLPEIVGLTGVPAPAVIDAVRQHCAPLVASEARP